LQISRCPRIHPCLGTSTTSLRRRSRLQVSNINIPRGFFQPGSAMITMWYVVYCTIFAMIALLIPFAQFFYETDDEKTLGKRILEAICFESILLAILITLLMIGFVYLKAANIPVETISQTFVSDTSTSFVTSAPT